MQIGNSRSAYLARRNIYDLVMPQENDAKAAPNAKAPAHPGQAPAPAPDAQLAQFKKELLAFQAEQETPGGHLAFQMAIPVNERGYGAIPTPAQQKLVNEIFIRHQNDAELQDSKTIFEQTALWSELTENEVNAAQIVKNAKFFYAPDGSIVDRRTATSGVDRMV